MTQHVNLFALSVFKNGFSYPRFTHTHTHIRYRVPDMLVGVNHAAAGTDGNKFYVFGGRTLTANQLGAPHP